MHSKIVLLLAASLSLFAETHQVAPPRYYRTFSATNAVIERIRPGDVVITKTLDSGGQDYKSEHAGPTGNPLTGPFYVEGAEPGDTLVVTLRKVRLNRNWGYMGYRLGLVSLLPESIESLYSGHYKKDLVRKGSDTMVPWDIDVARGTVHLREPVSSKVKLEFPAHPMLGCIGVAPGGESIPDSGPSGAYGGNMDYNQVAEGAKVMFPVSHPGAYFYLGDGHALMADGEPIGSGIETSMDVEFSVDLKKHAKITGPRLETDEYLISVGAQPEFSSSLNRALQMATTDMTRWLAGEYGIEPWAAHMLIGTVGKYDVVTVAGTMALRIPKRYLSQ